jgi:hypothetical protein
MYAFDANAAIFRRAWRLLPALAAILIPASVLSKKSAMLSRSASERISLCFFALASTRISVWRSRVWEATGIAERYAALEMLQEVPGIGRVTVGGDKGFDTADFARECRNLRMTPHVAQNLGRRGGSAIDGRTTQHTGYRISQKKRERIEECFGWLKTIALLRKVRHRGT